MSHIFYPIEEYQPFLYYKGKINKFFYNLCIINKKYFDLLINLKVKINLRNIKFVKLLYTFNYKPLPNYKLYHIIDDFGNIINWNYFNKCFIPKYKIYMIKDQYEYN